MAMLVDLGGYLATQSGSLTLGTNFFYSIVPESPDNCVALTEDGGVSPIFTQGSTNAPKIERPQLQLYVRNTSYETGMALAENLYMILTSIANQNINGVQYLRVIALGNPSLIERDQTKRVLISCNFDVMRLV